MTLTLTHPIENSEFKNAAATSDVSFTPTESAPLEQEVSQLVVLLGGGELVVDLVSESGTTVIATDRASGLFGEGDDVDEALFDLIAHLDLSLRDLTAHEGRLSAEMAAELARLRSLFRE